MKFTGKKKRVAQIVIIIASIALILTSILPFFLYI